MATAVSYSVVVVTPPAIEPLSLDDAKLHLRVSSTEEDSLITDLISAARQWVEAYLNRSLITQTLRLRADAFPDTPARTVLLANNWPGLTLESYLTRASALTNGPLYLQRPPLQSVTSIQYYDSTGASQTLSPSLYLVDSDAEPARVSPVYGQSWPSLQARIGALNVTYVAGYGDTAASVPLAIKQAIRLMVSQFYEFREPVVPESLQEVPLSVRALLDAYRVPEWD
jgi:uncharacterized phiE125 gp8 family phage protein